ncbi:MAG: substrate-binding domain-containing protein [Novosphingobium sp.]
MSNHLKSSLLAATAAVFASATPAHAQLVYPAADLHGIGATSVQDMWPREANCTGGFKFATGATVNSYTVNANNTVSPRNLGNAAYAGADGAFDCALKSVQPNLTVKYIGIGSGSGRGAVVATNAYTAYQASGIKQPDGTTSPPANPNAAIFGSDVSTWTAAHYALSDSPMSSGNVTSFGTNKPTAGKLIQIPLYVLPVAVAYNREYAYKNTGTLLAPVKGTGLVFNVTGEPTATVNSVPATPIGGLRLSKVAYCGIFNGNITNWNDARIAATNWQVDAKGAPVISKTTKKPILVALWDQANDNAARWNSEGAPVRLVGRLDKSGTTDIFSRHLANACTDSLGGVTNRFSAASESLPFDPSGAIDMREFRGDTNYFPGSAAANFAGSSQSLNGIAYKDATNGFVPSAVNPTLTEGVVVSATGTRGSGRFIVASGGGNVITAVNSSSVNTPGALIKGAGAEASADALLFNGKIGYISADQVMPAVGAVTASARLEVGATFANGTGKKPSFVLANAITAQAAFGKTVLPPESLANGKYSAGSTGAIVRSNPLDWYNALYGAGSSLANPSVGYPMTGTTQFVTGTCFANPDTRNAVTTFLTSALGKTLVDSKNAKLSKNLYTGIKTGLQGIRTQYNIAPMNKTWTTAIYNTFLASVPKDNSLDLYIQNGLPGKVFAGATGLVVGTGVIASSTAATGVKLPTTVNYKGTTPKTLTKTYTEAQPNPSCTPGAGLAAL